jgi:thiamine pyrophosphate-dependent acetolactate synthase large subunit-like protein
MLADSRRPLIYAGGGVIKAGASESMRALSDAFGIPVVTTLMGLGAMDTTRPSPSTCWGCTARRTRTTPSTTATC